MTIDIKTSSRSSLVGNHAELVRRECHANRILLGMSHTWADQLAQLGGPTCGCHSVNGSLFLMNIRFPKVTDNYRLVIASVTKESIDI
ncbi:MAG: hypothetical protein HOI35_13015 [Woeseia sp.]|nr:hypothetical protein [Woeseia sp.]